MKAALYTKIYLNIPPTSYNDMEIVTGMTWFLQYPCVTVALQEATTVEVYKNVKFKQNAPHKTDTHLQMKSIPQ